MKRTSSELLEFEALKTLLARYIQSPLGRTELESVAPISDRFEIERALGEVAEAIEYLSLATRPQPAARGAAIRIRFNSIAEVSASVQILRIEGAGLEGRQVLELLELLDRAGEARSLLLSAQERFPKLAARASAIADFRPLLSELSGKILPDGSVADTASVALQRLRRDIERQQRLIQESLERFLRAHREDGILQEEFITIRNERFVVPVVAGQKRKIDGVIHGSSSSGQTLFIEPLDTIDLNNELVRLTEEELREVHRILREMTAKLRESAPHIVLAVAVMGALDLVFAKAQFALDFRCVIPRFSPPSDRRLNLKAARHPLLEDILRKQNKPVVPISLDLDNHHRTLLISGPNTGGKTVSMKTVGLLALMAQAALPVPAEGAEFPLFDQVLADIGDNQSIQESLSTFSAHIAQIREMLDAVTLDSLVLLDELGAATDPEEGGALGVAILDTFQAGGAFTIASTHLLALKVYGANTEGVRNGSMGFDDETLEPTYVLRLGAPGKSAGLDIASRLGLGASLIEHARSVMSGGERDLAKFLSELHRRLDATAQREEELIEQREQLVAREQALAHEWEKRGSAKIRELEQRCATLVEQFEQQARVTIDQITQQAGQRKAVEQAERKVAKTKREFLQQVEGISKPPGSTSQPAAKKIEEGTRVRLKGIRQPARVRRVLSEGRYEVEAGFIKMQILLEDVEEVLPALPEGSKLPTNISFESGPRWDVSYREINVIGKRAEEACEQVDKFLDSAAMASVDRVRVIHGHGMGILKRAIAELLGANPHVEKFYAASANEGGTGATIVELRAV